VVVASRGIEGLDLAIKEMQAIPDGHQLPDLSGREVTTKLRSDVRFRTLPIVASPAEPGREREKAIAAGATGYLTKPVDIDKLPGQVESYLKVPKTSRKPTRSWKRTRPITRKS